MEKYNFKKGDIIVIGHHTATTVFNELTCVFKNIENNCLYFYMAINTKNELHINGHYYIQNGDFVRKAYEAEEIICYRKLCNEFKNDCPDKIKHITNKVFFDLIEWFMHKVSVESPEVISDFFTTPTFVDNICCDVWNILINIEEKFDYSTLQTFDKIMIKVHGVWEISFFGYHYNNGYYVMNGDWVGKKDIIPYNHETKHLLGTTNEKPKKYI